MSSSLDRDVSVSEALSCCLVVGASCCCSGTASSCGCSGMGSSGGCCSEADLSCEVDGFGSEVFTSEVRVLFDAFLPGSYFLPLIVRWSFFSTTAKTLATCNCVHLELKSSFLIKKCAAAAKHLVGSLKSSLANFGWKGHGSIKLQQFSSVSSSGVSLSLSNLSSVGADKCGGIFN